MKLTKIISGIALILMAIIIVIQFKFDSFLQALLGYADLGSTTSILVALAFLVVGTVYIVCSSSPSIVPSVVGFVILLLGGAMGIINALRFPGIMVWSWIGIIIGIAVIIASLVTRYLVEPSVDQYGNAHSNSYYDNNGQPVTPQNNYQQPPQQPVAPQNNYQQPPQQPVAPQNNYQQPPQQPVAPQNNYQQPPQQPVAPQNNYQQPPQQPVAPQNNYQQPPQQPVTPKKNTNINNQSTRRRFKTQPQSNQQSNNYDYRSKY
ncbi:hypothetical protein [Bombilactobacillus thymidiniphilus]|uniref:hypothetical protein n=1 Tax=Bombilactobacillus thymidiniphilus TaxID=2923363 RepID=UPI0021D5F19E|nr:hypothetical protein [Bombilactobacillus thymidiniphilus]